MLDRLGDVIGRAAFKSADNIGDGIGRGYHDNRYVGIAMAGLRQQIQTGSIGQVEIDEHQVRLALAQGL